MPLLSVLLGAATGQVVGGLWYSPLLFKKSWMKSVQQMSEDNVSTSHRTGIPVAMVSNITLACTVDHALPVMDLGDTGRTLAMVAGGFSLMSMAFEAPFYPFEGRPLRLFFINMGYNATRITLITAVLLYFKK
ncbi:uncharacterized protein LOC144447916 [Glandiceps talaboti]